MFSLPTPASLYVRDYESNHEGSEVIGGELGARCSAKGTHMMKARPGHHWAPQSLSSGRNIFELLGRGFTLLAFGVDEEGVVAFTHAASVLEIPLSVVRADATDGGAYEARLILVRPDQFVAWVGQAVPTDPHAVLSRAVGRS
jgi:hypothetical protein